MLPRLPMLHVDSLTCHSEQYRQWLKLKNSCASNCDPAHDAAVIENAPALLYIFYQTYYFSGFYCGTANIDLRYDTFKKTTSTKKYQMLCLSNACDEKH